MQQILDLIHNPEKSFENFICESNADIKHKLSFFLNSQDLNTCIIRGQQGHGKTHLLAACCIETSNKGQQAYLLTLKQPGTIENMLKHDKWADLICIDDVQLAVGNENLELLLFRIYNKAEQTNSKLIWATSDLAQKPFSRKDLNSRYCAMLLLELNPYTIAEINLIVKHFILHSQIVISDDACKLLVKEYTRNLSALISKLKEIDAYANSQKKKITLKICRDLIGGDLHQLD